MKPDHCNATNAPRVAPFWGFEDLALFLGAVLPAGWSRPCCCESGACWRRAAFSNNAVRALVFQVVIYVLLVGALYLVIACRYRRPFWHRWAGRSGIAKVVVLFGGPGAGRSGSPCWACSCARRLDNTQIEGLIRSRARSCWSSSQWFWGRCSRKCCFAGFCSHC